MQHALQRFRNPDVVRVFLTFRGILLISSGGSSRLSTYKSNIQAGPAPAPSGWKELGCLTDGGARTFDGYSFTSSKMNYTLCATTCGSKGYNYAGVSYGRECYCGNTQRATAKLVASTDCNVACAGDMYSKCGGSWRLTGFVAIGDKSVAIATVAPSTTTSSATSTATSSSTTSSSTTSSSTTVSSTTSSTSSAAATPVAPAGWQSLGCWTDSGNPRTLNGYKWSSGTSMTYESCTLLCGKRGFAYAGIEYSGECFCDAQINGGKSVPMTDCNMKCSGDNTQAW
jgi:hypothetical protein